MMRLPVVADVNLHVCRLMHDARSHAPERGAFAALDLPKTLAATPDIHVWTR